MDPDSVCSALMHDVLEDCNVQKNNLAKIFGDDVAHIVDGVSKLGKIETKNIADKNANNLQKMALAMANDVRVILVKLCDRLHNMRTIEHVPRKKQIQKARETLELYGPLALRVGMQDIRAELEDLSFRCMHPMRAKMLENAIKSSSGGRKKIVEKIRKELKKRLKSNDIEDVAVKGREKNLYSIYSKIKTKHKPFSEILDVYGFRILVDSVDDCYRSLGIIHNLYTPLQDYIYVTLPLDSIFFAKSDKILAVSLDEKLKLMSGEGGEFENGKIKFKTRSFGPYTLMIDTIPPSIKPINIYPEKNMQNENLVKFKIEDELSGIKTFNGYINNQWELFEFDKKTGILSFEFTSDFNKKISNEIEIIVTDERNNRSIYTGSFIR